MTSQGVKFYKFSNSTSQADSINSAKAVEGAIIYIVDLKQIWIGGSSPILAVAGSTDVSFNTQNSTLTVTAYNPTTGAATTQNLNFSDVASASSMMAVFEQIYTKMGLTGANHDTIDYTGTNYLADLGGQGEPALNLVNADKALDTAIYGGTHKAAATGAVYDTEHLSSTWTTVVTTNAIAADDTLDEDIDKLDKKVAQLANEVINNEQVTNEAFTAVANSVGLESDMSLDLSGDTTHIISGDHDVKSALYDLAEAIETNQLDVQVNGNSIVSNNEANIAVDGNYNASSNKIASESTVSTAIDAISGAGLEVDNTGAVTATTQSTSDNQANVATTAFVHNVVDTLDGSATIASVSNNVVTIKTGVTEVDGVINNDSGTDIVLEEVAVTGAAADVSIADAGNHTTQTNVEGALQEIYGRVETLEGSFDVIKSTNAATTPAGVTWIDETDPEHPQTVTGSLAASDATFHKIYLVPVDSTGTNKYAEYITTKETSGQTTTYGWERLGTIDVDLTGYVKNITLNGKQYSVDNNSVNITLTDVITGVTGEAAISGGDTNYVKVAANTVKDTTNGTNVTTLSTTVQLEEVADALTKDSPASYTEGHYVIENGKLVSAVGKSTGDTYTIANNGLTTAADVAAYVESKTGEGISSLDADVTSDDQAVATVRVVEVDGKITDVVVTNVSAGVTYTQSTASTAPDLAAGSSAAAQAGAVTGADIATIKSYVDDAATLRWEEYQ